MEEEFRRLEDENKWETHFKMLLDKSRKHSFEIGDAGSNSNLNRYLDVKPYDKTRIKLSRAKTDYINANLVTVPKAARQYILTQGPLPETVSHFWLMVWEQKSNVIVMLNLIYEAEDFQKCEQYWPAKVDVTIDYEDVKLKITLKSEKEKKHYKIREILLEDLESKKSRTILQFHYTAWPDYGEPESPTSILRLLTAIRKSGGLDKMDEPTIVHCSAGIGRSGTFCLIDSILSMVENQGTAEGIDIVNTLIDMRDYRMGLIQSPVQLRFAYMAIIYGIKILERANKLHPHMSSIKDSIALDNNSTQQQRINGSGLSNNNGGGQKPRRIRKKQNSSNTHQSTTTLNIFKKHLLVEAMDNVDSDSADSLFYDIMNTWPNNIKKPRNSSPEELLDKYLHSDSNTKHNGSAQKTDSTLSENPVQQTAVATKAEKLTNAINSLLNDNTISTNPAFLANPLNQTATDNSVSVLIRRRERELRNQKLAEKTMEIKNRMKTEELKREQHLKKMAFFRKSATIGGVAALVLSSIVYFYLHGSTSS